jgi:hypothetical protein
MENEFVPADFPPLDAAVRTHIEGFSLATGVGANPSSGAGA